MLLYFEVFIVIIQPSFQAAQNNPLSNRTSPDSPLAATSQESPVCHLVTSHDNRVSCERIVINDRSPSGNKENPWGKNTYSVLRFFTRRIFFHCRVFSDFRRHTHHVSGHAHFGRGISATRRAKGIVVIIFWIVVRFKKLGKY